MEGIVWLIVSHQGVICLDCGIFLTKQSALQAMMEHSHDTKIWKIQRFSPVEHEYRERLLNVFAPWMSSTHKAGSYEYAIDVQEMLMADGLVTQITKDDDWYYCKPINE